MEAGSKIMVLCTAKGGSDGDSPRGSQPAESPHDHESADSIEVAVSVNSEGQTRLRAWNLSGDGPPDGHAPGESDGMTGRLFDSLKDALSKDGEIAERDVWVAVLPAASASESQSPAGNGSNHRLVMLARKFTGENLRKRITTNLVAKTLGVSIQHFCRVFQRETGMPFMRYVAQLRADRACELLSTTHKSIKETAYESGFGSIAQFNRHFKKLIGVSPTKYRERQTS